MDDKEVMEYEVDWIVDNYILDNPRVLNKHKDKLEAPFVYIGRPGAWGNPFLMFESRSREEVVEMHKVWFLHQPAIVAAAKAQLRGKNLVCFCAPLPCHGDILLKIANG